MHRKEGERCASRREDVCPPPSPFFLANVFAVEFMAGGGERFARRMTCVVHGFECPGCIVQSAFGLLTRLHRPQGGCYPFSPSWCMYIHVYCATTCVDLIRREVQRPCHVNEKSAFVRTCAKLCGNASGVHMLSCFRSSCWRPVYARMTLLKALDAMFPRVNE